jgi:hypothetical protein
VLHIRLCCTFRTRPDRAGLSLALKPKNTGTLMATFLKGSGWMARWSSANSRRCEAYLCVQQLAGGNKDVIISRSHTCVQRCRTVVSVREACLNHGIFLNIYALTIRASGPCCRINFQKSWSTPFKLNTATFGGLMLNLMFLVCDSVLAPFLL